MIIQMYAELYHNTTHISIFSFCITVLYYLLYFFIDKVMLQVCLLSKEEAHSAERIRQVIIKHFEQTNIYFVFQVNMNQR